MKNDPSLSEASQTILIVDDLPEILQLLGGMLKESGYKVRPVTSGKLAIQAATLEPPDLVLLDVCMPDMNGYEVCKQLKAIPALDDIPVIFVSGLTEVIDKVQAFSVGGVDYVTKPFQLEEVEARVRTHLDLRRQKRQLRESYSQLRILEELRDDLVHMIVHDMGSPLMAVQVFLELIGRAGGGLSPERSRTRPEGQGVHRHTDRNGWLCPGRQQDGAGGDETRVGQPSA